MCWEIVGNGSLEKSGTFSKCSFKTSTGASPQNRNLYHIKTFRAPLCTPTSENHRTIAWHMLEGNKPRNKSDHESYYPLRFLGLQATETYSNLTKREFIGRISGVNSISETAFELDMGKNRDEACRGQE